MQTEARERRNDDLRIRALLAERTRALREKNVDDMLDVFGADAVCFDLPPPLRAKTDDPAYRKGLEGWFESWRGPIVVNTEDLRVTLDGDVGFAYGLEHIRGTKTDGTDVDLWYRATTCFRRQRGHWTIAHAHYSVPFYMDGSLRAAVDLAPVLRGSTARSPDDGEPS